MPASSTASLFRPFTLNGLRLRNRVAMAPMTRKFSPGGVPGADVAEYYRRRAAGGVALVFTEGAAVAHPAAVYDPAVPSLHGTDAMAGWRRVVDAVHAEGAAIFAQLWHVGAFRKPGDGPNPDAPPLSPSGFYDRTARVGEPMTQADIDAAVAAYGHSAAQAMDAGFDGIEVHAAHGYLIDQFLWDGTNRRTDAYNGTQVQRTRFAAEVIAECRRRTGPAFPLSVRFSQWKQQDFTVRMADTPAALAALLAPLVEAGADLLHCSTRRFWEPEFPGSALTLAGWVKHLTGRPTVAVGSVGLARDTSASFGGETAEVAALDELEGRMGRDEFDLVAVGRALLGDPDWLAKVRDNQAGALLAFAPAALKVLA